MLPHPENFSSFFIWHFYMNLYDSPQRKRPCQMSNVFQTSWCMMEREWLVYRDAPATKTIISSWIPTFVHLFIYIFFKYFPFWEFVYSLFCNLTFEIKYHQSLYLIRTYMLSVTIRHFSKSSNKKWHLLPGIIFVRRGQIFQDTTK